MRRTAVPGVAVQLPVQSTIHMVLRTINCSPHGLQTLFLIHKILYICIVLESSHIVPCLYDWIRCPNSLKWNIANSSSKWALSPIKSRCRSLSEGFYFELLEGRSCFSATLSDLTAVAEGAEGELAEEKKKKAAVVVHLLKQTGSKTVLLSTCDIRGVARHSGGVGETFCTWNYLTDVTAILTSSCMFARYILQRSHSREWPKVSPRLCGFILARYSPLDEWGPLARLRSVICQPSFALLGPSMKRP